MYYFFNSIQFNSSLFGNQTKNIHTHVTMHYNEIFGYTGDPKGAYGPASQGHLKQLQSELNYGHLRKNGISNLTNA